MTLCLATPDGYDPLPPRCHLFRGHTGDHQATRPMTGPAHTWPNENPDAEENAA